MTTDKQVADSLTTQGKGMPENSAPPQTIIGTFDTLESVRNAAISARGRVGVGLGTDIVKKYGCKIADLPQDKWQEAGEWFDSLVPIIPAKVDGGAEGIIRPGKFASGGIVPDSIREAILPSNFDGDGPGEEDGPWAKGWEDRVGGPKIIRDAEHRRQTVQAEAMVNLAVGYTLVQFHATIMKTTPDLLDKVKRSMKIYPEALAQFQRDYSVDQQIDDAGVVTIIVTPKEV